MSRRIRILSLQSTSEDTKPDGYFDRVVKYIPTDVIGAWVAVNGVIKTAASTDPNNIGTILWVLFGVFFVLTGLWVWRQTAESQRPTARLQIFISMIAFGVWVFALGGPFATLGFYKEYYGTILLIIFSSFAGLLTPKE